MMGTAGKIRGFFASLRMTASLGVKAVSGGRKTGVATLAVLLIAAPTLADAQEASGNGSFTLKVQSDIVLTNVVVRDKKTGEVVKGLKASDFSIFENGKPQKIASFDYQNVDEAAALNERNTVAGSASVGSKVADMLNGNFAANTAQLRDHRLIVMFFDLSSMQPEDVDRAVDAAKDYINKKMQPADLVALVHTP